MGRRNARGQGERSMSKRFYDSEMNKDRFVKLLPFHAKVIYTYILVECDYAGVWKFDPEGAEAFYKVKFDWPQILLALHPKVIDFANGEKWLICNFTQFQYGVLKPEHKVHKNVIKTLQRHGIDPTPFCSPKKLEDVLSQSVARVEPQCSQGGPRVKEEEKAQAQAQEEVSISIAVSPPEAPPATASMFDPVPLANARPVPDSQRWNYERDTEWARALVKAQCKIGSGNWTKWQGLVEEFGLPRVITAAKAVDETKRWDDETARVLRKSGSQTPIGQAVRKRPIIEVVL